MEPDTNIDGQVKVDEDKVDFATWVFNILVDATKVDPDEDEKVFCCTPYRRGDKNLYLWSYAEEDEQRQLQQKSFDLNYFIHGHHLHLIKNAAGNNIVIVFTHKTQFEASNVGDLEKVRAAKKEAKAESAIKRHQGGRADVNECLLVSTLKSDDIRRTWPDAPAWQHDLVDTLRTFIGKRLFVVNTGKEFKSWRDQWSGVFGS